MKWLIFVAIAFVALVAADDEWKPEVDDEVHKKWHQECIPVSGVTTEQIEKMVAYEYAEEKGVQEHIRCLAKKAGLFTDENGYNADRLKAQFVTMRFNRGNELNAITMCVNNSNAESSPGVRAHADFMCILRNLKKKDEKEEKEVKE